MTTQLVHGPTSESASLGVRGAPLATPAARTLLGSYENLLLVYLASLLYVYPYGIPLSADSSIRVPDLLGLLCLLAGAVALILRRSIRVDRVFLMTVGPFLLLELATPVLGAIGYRQPLGALSSVRMAILWLPMVLLTLLAEPMREADFEGKLARLLTVTLWLNTGYALVQIAVDLGYAPGWLAFTRLLEPWAVDRQFEVVLGLRPAGFFVNTTVLSMFGIVCLCFFYARYVSNKRAADLRYALLAIFLVALTTSRAAAAAVAVIISLGWFALTVRRKLLVLLAVTAAIAALLLVVEQTVGIDQAFYRFRRLVDSGLLADVSFGGRVRYTWPAALRVAMDYPFGTLISAPKVAVLIDSGYLTYYVQGKWLFVAAVTWLLAGQWYVGVRCLRRPSLRPAGLMILFLTAYLTGAMIITNPLRSPLVIAFIVLAYWKLKAERQSAWLGPERPVGAGLP